MSTHSINTKSTDLSTKITSQRKRYRVTEGPKESYVIQNNRTTLYLLEDPNTNEKMPFSFIDNGKNKTIIFTHGGPGVTPLNWFPMDQGWNDVIVPFKSHLKYFSKEANYVLWQQRGSYYATGSNNVSLINLDQFLNDFRELTQFIRNVIKDDVLILEGHSWGGSLVYYYLAKFAENLLVDGAIIEASPLN